MLQMALRMASEMSEPVMDLENSIEPVPVNTGSVGNECVAEKKFLILTVAKQGFLL